MSEQLLILAMIRIKLRRIDSSLLAFGTVCQFVVCPVCSRMAAEIALVRHLWKLLKRSIAYVDILQNPDIRAELPKFANWPTFPQLWVEGELVGGCDIMIEMFQAGELQTLIKEVAAKHKQDDAAAE